MYDNRHPKTEENEGLIKTVTNTENKNVLFNIVKDKFPFTDNFSADFFLEILGYHWTLSH